VPPPTTQFQRRLRDHEVARLGDRRFNGETIGSLSDAFGINRTTVMAVLRRTTQSTSAAPSKSDRIPTRKNGRSSRAIAASTSKSTDQ
jgi:hypothetical protein